MKECFNLYTGEISTYNARSFTTAIFVKGLNIPVVIPNRLFKQLFREL